MRSGLFALLGLLFAALLRLPIVPDLGGADLRPHWPLWLLAGAGAGLLTVLFARPARGWGWLWRPLATGLGFGLCGLVLFFLLALLTQAAGLPVSPTPVAEAGFLPSWPGERLKAALDLLDALRPPVLILLSGAAFTALTPPPPPSGRIS